MAEYNYIAEMITEDGKSELLRISAGEAEEALEIANDEFDGIASIVNVYQLESTFKRKVIYEKYVD